MDSLGVVHEERCTKKNISVGETECQIKLEFSNSKK